jgi:hypothetical protein
MPVPCRISIDAGTPLTISTAATVILQGTNSASKPVRLKRIQMQSNQTGSTQQTVLVQLITYATATSTGGTTPTAAPVDDALVGVYTPATAFRAGTTTLGTTATNKAQWYWNTANPFDITEGMVEIQDEFAVSKVWALIIPTAPAASFNLTGTVNFEEFG